MRLCPLAAFEERHPLCRNLAPTQLKHALRHRRHHLLLRRHGHCHIPLPLRRCCRHLHQRQKQHLLISLCSSCSSFSFAAAAAAPERKRKPEEKEHRKGDKKAGASGKGGGKASTLNQTSTAEVMASVAESELAAAKERKAQKAAASSADVQSLDIDEPLPTGTTVKEQADCVHEVAVPPGYKYIPFSDSATPSKKPAKEYPFVLDAFQRQAIKCVERGESVLVSAHTSAGKTVVAEYAIALCLRDKQRVIYTSPIKALSNQKFRELQEEFSDVGLMTGDVTINPNASCLVMTTEILRSMLYRGSEVMREVGWVVFDEIHYMRDKERGVVWEETIILLPDNVHHVFLSATIPNALQFAQWICELHKQPCHVVYTDYRPTPLRHYIYPAGGDGLHLIVDDEGNFKEGNFMKAMSALNDAAGKNPAKKRKGTKGPSECFRIVKLIMEKNYQPVIVFSFSKRDCEAHALQMSKLDFNTEEESKAVEEVFQNAIEILSDDDKKLPQVESVLPLLKRGIGIHHSGLLPILKEVIEILFSEGLVKALFATETFAMGLNMPAKTVVFTSVRKFDGKDFRWISGGEYIQMSGRAGRRGLDARGTVILMVDEKMEPSVGRQLLKGQADVLNSSFHLTYNMVLNLLRVEEINPEYMIEKSFFQFQQMSAIPDCEKKMKALAAERDAIVIENEESVTEYYDIRRTLETLGEELRRVVVQPKCIVPFLTVGRAIKVADWGWGVLVNFQRARSKGTDTEASYVVELLVACAPGSQSNRTPAPCPPSVKPEIQVVPFTLDMVEQLSAVVLTIPDLSGGHSGRKPDLRDQKKRQIVHRTLQEVLSRHPDGLPLLDPIEDMKIDSDDLRKTVRKIELLEKSMFSHPLHKSKQQTELVALCAKKAELTDQIRQLKRRLKESRDVVQMEELKARKRVLRKLNFCSSDSVIGLKGRVACEISTGDELLLTELIFNGVFNDLTPEQCVSLLSCFTIGEKNESSGKLKEDLAGPLRVMQDCARKIAKVCIDAKMELNEEEYVQSFKPDMMDVVFAWANGSRFCDICKMTKIFEGSIIRAMRRLEELLRQMCAAAKSIGNTDLENKFAEGINKIKRDIVFAASLYL
eukprot:m.283314 g.283314  ORF g.283314 m.283314 type:complete len:1104 (+) comp22905_c9_seq1:498-3809(+)